MRSRSLADIMHGGFPRALPSGLQFSFRYHRVFGNRLRLPCLSFKICVPPNKQTHSLSRFSLRVHQFLLYVHQLLHFANQFLGDRLFMAGNFPGRPGSRNPDKPLGVLLADSIRVSYLALRPDSVQSPNPRDPKSVRCDNFRQNLASKTSPFTSRAFFGRHVLEITFRSSGRKQCR